jgi:hypothetical protein
MDFVITASSSNVLLLDDHRQAPSHQPSVSLCDFRAYMPKHSYIFAPTRDMWPATSVNARIPPIAVLDAAGTPKLNKSGEPMMIPANTWLDQNQPVEQITWAPGLPMLIRDHLVDSGGWIEHVGVVCFKPVSAANRRARRPGECQPLDWPRSARLWRRRRPYHRVARASGAAPRCKDQPCSGPRWRPGHRQRHDSRTGQIRRRSMELH